MVNRPEVLAVVQARGGSKGLPGKNLRPLAGHPLVAWSVVSARRAVGITRTIISTDSPAIADVARRYGAEVPFLRPPELAADDTPDLPLFEHALRWLWDREGYRPDVVVQLRPTTPLRPKGLIDRALELLEGDALADCVRGVTTPKQTPYKMWSASQDGALRPLLDSPFDEPYNMPRQHLPQVWWQTGHIDAIRTTTILEKGSLTGHRVLPIVIDPSYCVDIDTASDFDAAARTLDDELDVDRPDRTADGTVLPNPVDAVIFDFDGVFTDNRVLVTQDGREGVLCHRGDGLGLSRLRDAGVPMLVVSTETNPVVAARCEKLRLPCVQGIADKAATVRRIAAEREWRLDHTVFVGNDVNDLAAMDVVGCAVVPCDAHPDVSGHAHLTLRARGGDGAVRELCDLVLQRLVKVSSHV